MLLNLGIQGKEIDEHMVAPTKVDWTYFYVT